MSLVLGTFVAGCGDGTVPEDAGPDVTLDATPDAPMQTRCERDSDCDDGLYCTGRETCNPASADADARGCVEGEAPCGADEECDEARERCSAGCVDEDGDGVDTCMGDCDDSNASVFPGNTEMCIPGDPTDEDCNPRTFGFLDVDGDGAADEGCYNEDEMGMRFGGTDCNDNNAAISPLAAERCDGSVDEDCDGLVDEDCLCTPEGSTRGCGSGLGECAGAVETCTASGWSACDRTPAAMDACDGTRDDDCDGTVDEGCGCVSGTSRSCGRGACAGLQTCTAGMWEACDGASPTSEMCDGLDTDCDGVDDASDPDVVGIGASCGSDLGACRAGSITCTGSMLVCTGSVGPRMEVCDGTADDDCDGVTDEGCTCTDGAVQPCGAGQCAGTQTCMGGVWQGCMAGGMPAPTPSTEICDGIDNDCDGVEDASDPDVVGVGDSCGTNTGVCSAGTNSCIGSSLVCGGPGYVSPRAETCNHLDDDCDGTTDDGVALASCSASLTPNNSLAGPNMDCYPASSSCEFVTSSSIQLGSTTSTSSTSPRSAFARWELDAGRRTSITGSFFVSDNSSDGFAPRGWVSVVLTPRRGVGTDPSAFLPGGIPALGSGEAALVATVLNGNRLYLYRQTSSSLVLLGDAAIPCDLFQSGGTTFFELTLSTDGPNLRAFVASFGCTATVNSTWSGYWTEMYQESASFDRYYVGAVGDNDDSLDVRLTELDVARTNTGSGRDNCLCP